MGRRASVYVGSDLGRRIAGVGSPSLGVLLSEAVAAREAAGVVDEGPVFGLAPVVPVRPEGLIEGSGRLGEPKRLVSSREPGPQREPALAGGGPPRRPRVARGTGDGPCEHPAQRRQKGGTYCPVCGTGGLAPPGRGRS